MVSEDENLSRRGLEQNEVIQKSLRRLQAMGLDVKVLNQGPNECFVFVNIASICKMIDKAITFTNRKITYENPHIVIYLWRVV